MFVSWLHPYKEQKLVVVGDRQMAVFDDMEETDKLVLYPHSIEWKNRVPIAKKAEGQVVPLDWGEPLRAECSHFLDCVETRARPRTDGEEALRVLTVLTASERALSPSPSMGAQALSAPRKDYYVHETSHVDDGAEIGDGTTIWHFSHIMKGSKIGKGCRIGQNVVIGPQVTIGDGVKIQNNVSVYEGVTLEDHVFCGPSMVFTNVFNPRSEIPRMDELRPTLVRHGATLGANCTIVCGTTIGQYAFVGAGAVVIDDVPDYALVVGNPGRIVGWMCRCGSRIDFVDGSASGVCRSCNNKYRKVGEEVSLQ